VRVSIPEHELKLPGCKLALWLAVQSLEPPLKATATEPLLAQPEAVAVVNQNFDCGRSAVAKYKGATTEWILSQHLPAESSEPIDAPAEINRIDRDQDAHL
jgi:hypothetical protein